MNSMMTERMLIEDMDLEQAWDFLISHAKQAVAYSACSQESCDAGFKKVDQAVDIILKR